MRELLMAVAAAHQILQGIREPPSDFSKITLQLPKLGPITRLTTLFMLYESSITKMMILLGIL